MPRDADDWKPKSRDKSMICRMAGNIAGPMLADILSPSTLGSREAEELRRNKVRLEALAKASVALALAIVKETESTEMTT